MVDNPAVVRTDGKAWERRPDESLEQWHAFIHYRDSQPRSVTISARYVGRTPRMLSHWAATLGWRERARAWDNELDRVVRDRQTDDVLKMRRNHAAMAVGMQGVVHSEVKVWIARVQEADAKALAEGKGPRKTPVLTIRDLVRLNHHATNLERISRGEPTEHIQASGERDLSSLSPGELLQYKLILKKLRGAQDLAVEGLEDDDT